jgi:hypothetical protein
MTKENQREPKRTKGNRKQSFPRSHPQWLLPFLYLSFTFSLPFSIFERLNSSPIANRALRGPATQPQPCLLTVAAQTHKGVTGFYTLSHREMTKEHLEAATR